MTNHVMTAKQEVNVCETEYNVWPCTTVSEYEANKWPERPFSPTSSNITTVMTHGGTVTALMNERLGRLPGSG